MPTERSTLLAGSSAASAAQDGGRNSSSSTSKNKMFWTLGCVYGAAAVGFGAFGAHGLKKIATDPARIASFATAAHYQVCFPFPFLFPPSSRSCTCVTRISFPPSFPCHFPSCTRFANSLFSFRSRKAPATFSPKPSHAH